MRISTSLVAVSCAAFAAIASLISPAQAELSIREFFVGQPPFQMYVQQWKDSAPGRPALGSLILIHGGAHTGVGFTTTPNGEEGWALNFARRGWDVYVVDWPGLGRSGSTPANSDESILDVANTLGELIKKVGPAVLVGHSIGGALGIKLSERDPASVRALVALAPAAVEIPNKAVPRAPLGTPILVPRQGALSRFANSDLFPKDPESVENYISSLVAMSPKIRNAAIGITDELKLDRSKTDLWKTLPVLYLVAENDMTVPRASSDETARLMGVKPVALGADWGMPGHGHMFPLEKGQSDIAGRVHQWLVALRARK